MQRSKIDWCDYSINPIKGICKHACSYCYAIRMYKRFKWNPAVRFMPEELDKLKSIKTPSTIFVCSTHDIMGKWILGEWIEEISKICGFMSEHRFMFLTKNPRRYHDFHFPSNCWLGATAESGNKLGRINAMKGLQNKTFLSIEPILGDFSKIDLSDFEQIIVGADSSIGASKPKQEWIDSIQHRNIFYKENLITKKD